MERRRVSSGSPYEPAIGISRAVRVGQRVLVSGTAPIWPDDHVAGDVTAQTRRCLEIIASALSDAGAGLADVVRTRVYLVDRADGDAIARVHGDIFGQIRPVSTFVVVSGFLDPRWRVEIEAEAITSGASLA